MKKTPLFLVFAALLSASCSQHSEPSRAELLQFLYANMPLPDSVDYDEAFFTLNVDASLQARREMPWGESVPEREFMHFVLPVRVNNENLDDSRLVFYHELRDRVKGLSMADAILEVNHWCHEKVTYTPSDERTSSPLATVKTAYGRCGEESVLLVSALRSVCIPARQVYTPRWAHTDDNHAWVEAWADGEWHFLGACEPEPVLDLGWFNAPASRGLLMHTKAFGRYDGPEEVMSQTACYTELNVTANYAPVGKAWVRVVDGEGKAVSEAAVDFKIYNYAEFYTVSTKQTDAQGVASLEAGMGDLVAWARKDGSYGFTTCSPAKGDTALLVLDKRAGERYSMDLEIVPPVERNTLPEVTAEQREANAQRLAYEDSLRMAYIATFDTSTPLLAKSRGNHAVLQQFLDEAADRDRAEALLSVVSDKDLRDISMEVLCDAYDCTPQNEQLPADFYNKYVLNPRVANEMLRPHRALFRAAFSAEEQAAFRADASRLMAWVRDNIKIDTERNPQRLRMSPAGVLRHRVTDETSRNIFFVALSRSLGIPARINPVTGALQTVDAELQWVNVDLDSDFDSDSDSNQSTSMSKSTSMSTSKLHATYTATPELPNPKYYSHFTLARITDGAAQLLSYAEEDTYQTLLKDGVQVEAGDYMLLSGTRLAGGSVLAHVEIFPAAADAQVTVPLVMRSDTEQLRVIGSLNSEALYRDMDGQTKSLLVTTGRGYYIAALIAPNHEPTNHMLRDLADHRAELEQWSRTIMLLFRNQSEADRFRLSDFPDLPSTVVFGVDADGAIAAEMTGELPVVEIADTFNRVVFRSAGYSIGLGGVLSKAVRQL